MHNRTFLTMAALALLAPAATGCVDNGGLIPILGALVPTSAAQGCAASASSDIGTTLTRGVLDVDVYRDSLGTPPPYVLWPLIQNNLVKMSEGSSGSSALNEPNNFFIQGASVSLTLPTGLGLVPTQNCDGASFDSVGTVTIPPGGGYGTMGLTVIESCQALALRNQMPNKGDAAMVWVDMKVFGKAGGGDMESDKFSFPITVCRGCLRTGIPGPYAECDYFRGTCKCADMTEPNPATGWSCNVGQDYGPILCCLGSDNTTEICPAPDPQKAATN